MNPEAIKFGIAVSQSGRYAALGQQVLDGLRCCVDDINAAGGIRAEHGRRRTVTLVVEDDRGEVATLRAAIEKLIAVERIDILLGPYGSGLTLAAGAMAEAHGMVLWNHSGSADQIFAQGWRWQVGLISPASQYLCGVLEALHVADAAPRGVALFSAETGFAQAMADGVRGWLRQHAIALTQDRRYASGITDFYPALEAVRDDVPHWLLGVGRIEDDILLAEQLVALTSRPRALALVAAGIEQFHATLGTQAEGFLGPSQWEAGIDRAVDHGPRSGEFAARFRARNGAAADYPAAQGYAGGLIAQACIEAAGSVAQAALREAADRLRCTTLYGPFAIDPSSGRQTAHTLLVTQWQDGRRRVVWPAASADANLIYPRRAH